MDSGRFRVGFDIGGTFTDFVLTDQRDGSVRLHKSLTTPHDPAEGALAGLDELLGQAGIGFGDVDRIVHGTTLVTNAIIERKGARTALITTRGFRDLIEMGREQRYDIYDLFLKYPEPLTPRSLRFEVAERINRDGNVVTGLDVADAEAVVDAMVARGVEAVAVCFLHAYKNPAHERQLRDIIAGRAPELAISLSSEIVPEIREFDRASTTVANAFVQPLVERYVQRIEEAMRQRGFKGQFLLMQSAGGLATAATARRFPIRFLESGPAGGAMATGFFANAAGRGQVLAFDMGGTTAKACVIHDGRPGLAAGMEAARVHRFKPGSGMPIKAPVIDMIEIGAGGGSIARIDNIGLLKVGPDSAGAAPGPVAYGRGGSEPTVTDANLALGFLNPDFFLGGRLKLDAAATMRALERLGAELSVSALDAAWGVYSVVSDNMARAARAHIVEKGADPRSYTMLAIGGAGPAHASTVARILGIETVVIPPATGAASALGFLIAPISFEYVQSQPETLGTLDGERINRILAELEAQGRETMRLAGLSDAEIMVTRTAEMRLIGQIHEVTVPLPDGELGPHRVGEINAAFKQHYSAPYSTLYADAPIEALTWRVTCSGPRSEPRMEPAAGAAGANSLKNRRPAYFGPNHGQLEAAVHDRYVLRAGDRIEGPALIEEREATTVIFPGDHVEVDANGCLVIAVKQVPSIKRFDNSLAFAQRVAALDDDSIGLEIIWSRLVSITEEVWSTIERTTFSLIMSEARDFACDLLDARGRSLAHCIRGMPSFNLVLPRAAAFILERYPAETLKPGDVLVTNDPWVCAGHLNDVAIITPIFRENQLVAFFATMGHVTDIGGTKDNMHAREVYEEGFQIPPMKLWKAGVPNEDFFDLLRENVRNPDQTVGDIGAMISGNALGSELLLKLMNEYGLEDLLAVAEVIHKRAEDATRRAIRAIPNGTYTSEIMAHGGGNPVRLPVRVEVSDEDISIDFEGAPPQLPQGAVNSTISYTTAHTFYALKCILSPEVPANSGTYRAFSLKAPKGSILNCNKPASVYMRVRTGWFIAPNIFRALCEALPDRVQAFTGMQAVMRTYAVSEAGEELSDSILVGGGQGAYQSSDGKSTLMFPSSCANVSVEIFEARNPVFYEEKSLLPDSGGVGERRGGLGQKIRLRKLADDGREVLVGIYPEGAKTPQRGLFGGAVGGPCIGRFFDGETGTYEDCSIGALRTLRSTADHAEIILAGGSGYGDPAARALQEIEADLEAGYVTSEAMPTYSVVLDQDGRIDRARTAALRTRAASRTMKQPQKIPAE
jgi:5-oxoprolinase (ATP-hydrolysing)